MGTGFSLHCNDCGKDYTISLGVGMGSPRICDETLTAVRAGEYGPELQAAAESQKPIGVAAVNRIYMCPDCGHWEVLRDASIYGWANTRKRSEIPYVSLWGGDAKDYRLIKAFEPSCGKCGSAMHALDFGEDSGNVPQLTCNDCGTPLSTPNMVFDWD